MKNRHTCTRTQTNKQANRSTCGIHVLTFFIVKKKSDIFLSLLYTNFLNTAHTLKTTFWLNKISSTLIKGIRTDRPSAYDLFCTKEHIWWPSWPIHTMLTWSLTRMVEKGVLKSHMTPLCKWSLMIRIHFLARDLLNPLTVAKFSLKSGLFAHLGRNQA